MRKKKAKIPAKVVKYLEKVGIQHKVVTHRTVYTAIDAAMTMKRDLSEIAKSLLVKAGKEFYLVIMPADHNLDFDKLKKAIIKINDDKAVKVIKIPGEKIIENALKVKPGTLSAFGKIYKVEVILDRKMKKVDKAIFTSGSTNFSIEMKVSDFIEMENAHVANIGNKKRIKKQKIVKPKRQKKK